MFLSYFTFYGQHIVLIDRHSMEFGCLPYNNCKKKKKRNVVSILNVQSHHHPWMKRSRRRFILFVKFDIEKYKSRPKWKFISFLCILFLTTFSYLLLLLVSFFFLIFEWIHWFLFHRYGAGWLMVDWLWCKLVHFDSKYEICKAAL